MFFLDCLFHIFPFFILLVFISSHCNFCIAFLKFSSRAVFFIHGSYFPFLLFLFLFLFLSPPPPHFLFSFFIFSFRLRPSPGWHFGLWSSALPVGTGAAAALPVHWADLPVRAAGGGRRAAKGEAGALLLLFRDAVLYGNVDGEAKGWNRVAVVCCLSFSYCYCLFVYYIIIVGLPHLLSDAYHHHIVAIVMRSSPLFHFYGNSSFYFISSSICRW